MTTVWVPEVHSNHVPPTSQKDIHPSSEVLLHGLTIDSSNPFKINFIINKRRNLHIKIEANKLINYFLAALTTPEQDLWVNLSPQEPDRIIPDQLGGTQMGQDLLSQDYVLKQMSASFLSPESPEGKEFWNRVHKQAYEKFGTTDVPVDALNKVWIMPEVADVFEEGNTVRIANSRLRVQLDSEEGLVKSEEQEKSLLFTIHSSLFTEIIIPAIEQEVNDGQQFAPLRQMYSAMILAAWYKKRLKTSILNKFFADQNKTNGITTEDENAVEEIYAQYIDTFKKGAFHFIKEEKDLATGNMIPRKYFSGGFKGFLSKVVQLIKKPLNVPVLKLVVVTVLFLTLQGDHQEPLEMMADQAPVVAAPPVTVSTPPPVDARDLDEDEKSVFDLLEGIKRFNQKSEEERSKVEESAEVIIDRINDYTRGRISSELKGYMVDVMIETLSQPQGFIIQASVAKILRRLDTEKAFDFIRESLLNSQDEQLRWLLSDDDYFKEKYDADSEGMFHFLVQLLSDSKDDVYRDAAWTLSKKCPDRAFEFVIKAMIMNNNRGEETRVANCFFGTKERFLKPILELLSHSKKEFRVAGAQALAELVPYLGFFTSDEKIYPLLLNQVNSHEKDITRLLLEDDDLMNKALHAILLGQGKLARKLSPEKTPLMFRWLKSSNTSVRHRAEALLLERKIDIFNLSDYDDFVIEMLQDKRSEYRQIMVRVLTNFDYIDAEIVNAFSRMLHPQTLEENENVRGYILDALLTEHGLANKSQVLGVLVTYLRFVDDPMKLRNKAIEAISHIIGDEPLSLGDFIVVRILLPYLKEEIEKTEDKDVLMSRLALANKIILAYEASKEFDKRLLTSLPASKYWDLVKSIITEETARRILGIEGKTSLEARGFDPYIQERVLAYILDTLLRYALKTEDMPLLSTIMKFAQSGNGEAGSFITFRLLKEQEVIEKIFSERGEAFSRELLEELKKTLVYDTPDYDFLLPDGVSDHVIDTLVMVEKKETFGKSKKDLRQWIMDDLKRRGFVRQENTVLGQGDVQVSAAVFIKDYGSNVTVRITIPDMSVSEGSTVANVIKEASQQRFKVYQYIGHAGGLNLKHVQRRLIEDPVEWIIIGCNSVSRYIGAVQQIAYKSHLSGTTEFAAVTDGGVFLDTFFSALFSGNKRGSYADVRDAVWDKHHQFSVSPSIFSFPDDYDQVSLRDSDGDGIPDRSDDQYNILNRSEQLVDSFEPIESGSLPERGLMFVMPYVQARMHAYGDPFAEYFELPDDPDVEGAGAGWFDDRSEQGELFNVKESSIRAKLYVRINGTLYGKASNKVLQMMAGFELGRYSDTHVEYVPRGVDEEYSYAHVKIRETPKEITRNRQVFRFLRALEPIVLEMDVEQERALALYEGFINHYVQKGMLPEEARNITYEQVKRAYYAKDFAGRDVVLENELALVQIRKAFGVEDQKELFPRYLFEVDVSTTRNRQGYTQGQYRSLEDENPLRFKQFQEKFKAELEILGVFNPDEAMLADSLIRRRLSYSLKEYRVDIKHKPDTGSEPDKASPMAFTPMSLMMEGFPESKPFGKMNALFYLSDHISPQEKQRLLPRIKKYYARVKEKIKKDLSYTNANDYILAKIAHWEVEAGDYENLRKTLHKIQRPPEAVKILVKKAKLELEKGNDPAPILEQAKKKAKVVSRYYHDIVSSDYIEILAEAGFDDWANEIIDSMTAIHKKIEASIKLAKWQIVHKKNARPIFAKARKFMEEDNGGDEEDEKNKKDQYRLIRILRIALAEVEAGYSPRASIALAKRFAKLLDKSEINLEDKAENYLSIARIMLMAKMDTKKVLEKARQWAIKAEAGSLRESALREVSFLMALSGDFEKAADLAEQKIVGQKGRFYALLDIAEVKVEAKRGAKKIFAKALKVTREFSDPDDRANALISLGEEELAAGFIAEEVFDELRKAIRGIDDELYLSEKYKELAVLRFKAGKAAKTVRRTFTTAKNYAEDIALEWIVFSELKIGFIDDAKKTAAMMANSSDKVYAFVEISEKESELGNKAHARQIYAAARAVALAKDFTKGEDLIRSSDESLEYIAISEMEQGLFEDAVMTAKQIVKPEERDKAFFRLTKIHLKAKRFELAHLTWQQMEESFKFVDNLFSYKEILKDLIAAASGRLYDSKETKETIEKYLDGQAALSPQEVLALMHIVHDQVLTPYPDIFDQREKLIQLSLRILKERSWNQEEVDQILRRFSLPKNQSWEKFERIKMDLFSSLDALRRAHPDALKQIRALKSYLRNESTRDIHESIDAIKQFFDYLENFSINSDDVNSKNVIGRLNRLQRFLQVFLETSQGIVRMVRLIDLQFGEEQQVSYLFLWALSMNMPLEQIHALELLMANRSGVLKDFYEVFTKVPYVENRAERHRVYQHHWGLLMKYHSIVNGIEKLDLPTEKLDKVLAPLNKVASIEDAEKALQPLIREVVSTALGKRMKKSSDIKLSEELMNALVYAKKSSEREVSNTIAIFLGQGQDKAWEYIKGLEGNEAFKDKDAFLEGPGIRVATAHSIKDVEKHIDEQKQMIFEDIVRNLTSLNDDYPDNKVLKVAIYRLLVKLKGQVTDEKVEMVSDFIQKQVRLNGQNGISFQQNKKVNDISSRIGNIHDLKEEIILIREDEVTIYVSHDPIEILHLGVGFPSCLNCINGAMNERVAVNFLDLNKRVIYIKDSRGRRIGRVVVALAEVNGKEVLVPISTFFKNSNLKLDEIMLTYLKAYSEKLQVPLLLFENIVKGVSGKRRVRITLEEAFSFEIYNDRGFDAGGETIMTDVWRYAPKGRNYDKELPLKDGAMLGKTAPGGIDMREDQLPLRQINDSSKDFFTFDDVAFEFPRNLTGLLPVILEIKDY